MALSEAQRVVTRQELVAAFSQFSNPQPTTVTKDELSAAIAAIDDWVEVILPTASRILPKAARDKLTPKQKLTLFMAVLSRRFRDGNR